MKIFLLLLYLSVTTFASAQYVDATDAQKKDIIAKMTQASEGLNSMQCAFTQVKELSFMDDKVTSEGVMYYMKPDKIRWEYTQPYKYIFATDGKNITLTSGDNSNKLSAKSSKIFSSIGTVMIGGVSGAGIVDSPDFTTQFQVGKNDYKLSLTPLKKEIKDMFSAIHLYVGKSDSRVQSVELIEKTGDKTAITLRNIKPNIAIDEKMFSN